MRFFSLTNLILIIICFTTTISAANAGVKLSATQALFIPLSLSGQFSGESSREKVINGETVVNAKVGGTKGYKTYQLITALNVKAPKGFVKKQILDFESLFDMSRFIQEVGYSKDNGLLQMKAGIWSYIMSIDVCIIDDDADIIKMYVIDGTYKGMNGYVMLYDNPKKAKNTIVIFRVNYNQSDFPFPDFVMERGAEVAFRWGAKKMMSKIRNRYLETGGN